MANLTLSEKRLQTLRRQLQGGGETYHLDNVGSVNTVSSRADLGTATYLKKDLYKILIFASTAIALQFSLYFALQAGILRLHL